MNPKEKEWVKGLLTSVMRQMSELNQAINTVYRAGPPGGSCGVDLHTTVKSDELCRMVKDLCGHLGKDMGLLCSQCGTADELMPVGENKRMLCITCASNLLGYAKCKQCGVWTTDYSVVSDNEYCPNCRLNVDAYECEGCKRLFAESDVDYLFGDLYCEQCMNIKKEKGE